MGSWFSNLHIRKQNGLTEAAILQQLREMIVSQQYIAVESAEEADGCFAVLTDEKSGWYSVYSDHFSFADPELYQAYAMPISERLQTDVLGIYCFDSDYLFLNLINAAENQDAWAGVGSAAGLGINRRTNLKAWQNKTGDYDHFRECIRKKYVCAEMVLSDISACIQLPFEYSAASYEYLEELELWDKTVRLYFKLPESTETREPPQLQPRSYPLQPCKLDHPEIVTFLSAGGASKGLSVIFSGAYVEQEEITFSEVELIKSGKGHRESTPISLQKVQLADGHWVYYSHVPDYRILQKADDRLTGAKSVQAENEREITVRFVAHGNPRKVLDITVFLIPDENPAGQAGWNVWYQYGSKKDYIQFYNNLKEKFSKYPGTPLREEDFDL